MQGWGFAMTQTTCSADTIDVTRRGVWSRHEGGRKTRRVLSLLGILCLAILALATPQQAKAQITCGALNTTTQNAWTGDPSGPSCTIGRDFPIKNATPPLGGFHVFSFTSVVRFKHNATGAIGTNTPVCSGGSCSSQNPGESFCTGTCNITYTYLDNNGETVTLNITKTPSGINATTVNTGAFAPPDTTPPTVTVDIVDASLSDSDNSSNVTFTFSEAVNGFTVSDLAVAGGSISNFSFTDGNTSGSATFTATDGVRITGSVTVNANSYADLAGNNGSTGNDTVTIDTENPLFDNILLHNGTVTPTDADLLYFLFVFSEDMDGTTITTDDFMVSGTTADFAVNQITPTTYDLQLANGDLDNLNGTVTVGLKTTASITDAAGNALLSTTPGGTTNNAVQVVNDTTAPSLTSIVRKVPVGEFTNADTLFWDVTFSESVQSVDAADFSIANTTATFDVLTITGSVYQVRASGGDLANLGTSSSGQSDVPISLSLLPFRDIRDLSGNMIASNAATSGQESFRVYNDPVGVDKIELSPGVPSGQTAVARNTLTWIVLLRTADSSLTLSPSDFTVTGTTATPTVTKLFGNTFQVDLNGGDIATLDGPVSIALNTGITDRYGNVTTNTTPTVTDVSTVQVDNVAPVLTLSSTSPATVTGSFDITMSFSEPVTRFTIADIQVTNGTRTFTAVDSQNFTSTITPTTQGPVTVTIAAGAAEDAVGNGSTAAQLMRTFDAPPTVVSFQRGFPSSGGSTRIPETTDEDIVSWFIKFSEDITRPVAGDFVVTGTTSPVTISSVGNDEYEISLAGGDIATVNGRVELNFAPGQTIQDLTGNALDTSGTPSPNDNFFTMANDSVAPTLTSILRKTPTSENTNADTLTWEVTFSEAVQNVDRADFTLSGPTGATLSVSGSGTTYDVTASGGDLAGLSNRTVSLGLEPRQFITDLAGNALTNLSATGTVETYNVSNAAPTVNRIERVDAVTRNFVGSVTNADSLGWIITFDQISGNFALTPADFTVTGTTATVTSVTRFSIGFDVVVSGGDLANLDGNVQLGFSNTTPVDEFGNAFTNKTPSGVNQDTYTLDNTAPTLTSIERDKGTVSPTDADTLSFIFTYSEDLDVSAGNPANVVVTGTTANVTLTPISASVGRVTLTGGDLANLNGPVTVGLNPTNNIADPAGNALASINPTGTNNNTVQVQNDQTPPTVMITSNASGSVNAPFDVSFNFSEDVNGFALNDIAVGNGTAGNFVRTNAAVYSATITPAADGLVTVDVAAGAAQDGAGNNSEAADQFSVTQDTAAPTVSTSTPPGSVNGPFDLVFSFTEDMTGLTAEDFNVTNGTVVLTGGPRDFTVTITPDGNGDISVNLPANSATDPAGNGNEAFNATFSVEFDNTPPSVTTSTPPAAVNGPFDLVFNFTEDMTGLTAEDFNVTNGTVVLTGGPRDFTVTITPDGNGDISVNLPANSAFDPAGNGNEAFNANFNIEFDNEPPTVTASTPPAAANGPFDLVFSFTEDMTGLTAEDFNVTNGTVVLTGGPRDFTVTITPDGNGDVSINLPANSALDPAGNGNVAFEATIEVMIDQVAPTLSITSSEADLFGPFTATFTFSEDVTGFELADLVVTNGSASNLAGSGAVYTALITPDTVGAISVSVAANSAQDAAGNGNVAADFADEIVAETPIVELAINTSVADAGDSGGTARVTNPGTTPISFTAAADVPWLDVDPMSGTIPASGGIDFNVTLNERVDALPAGEYLATVTVTIVDDAVSTKVGSSAPSQSTAGLVLVEIPITVEVAERFGSFELVVQSSSTGPTTGVSFSYVSDIAEVDGLSVVAGSGESRTRVDQLLNGAYEITQSIPEGWRLESVSCSGDLDGETIVDPVAGKIDVDLDAGESLTCVFENVRDDEAIRLATQRAIRNFMARRGDRLLETAPDLSTRFTDRQSQEGGSFSANGSALRTQMDFRTSLAGFRNKAEAKAVGDNKDLTKPVMDGWDIWVGAEYSRVEDERVGSGIDAKFFAAQVGVDYQVKENLIVGGLVQYDWMSEEDEELAEGVGAVAGAQVEGDGFMVGPYAVWQATDTLVLDAMGLWGTSDNTVNPLGYYEDDFETTRFMLRANATGEFRHGRWTVRPQLTWSHYEDKQDAYVDSLGIDIPSQTVTIGRLRAGPEVTWTQGSEEGAELELGASLRANWDYDGPGLLDQTGRLSDGGSDLRADGDLLMGLKLPNGLSLRARVGIDGIGKGNFDAKSGRLELNFPFGGKGGSGVSNDADRAFQALNTALGERGLGPTGFPNNWEQQQVTAYNPNGLF